MWRNKSKIYFRIEMIYFANEAFDFHSKWILYTISRFAKLFLDLSRFLDYVYLSSENLENNIVIN